MQNITEKWLDPVDARRKTYKGHPSLSKNRTPFDYAVKPGTPVLAVNHGIVKEIVMRGKHYADWIGPANKQNNGKYFDYSPYGYYIVIEHFKDGKPCGESAYCHMHSGKNIEAINGVIYESGIFVQVGDEVKQGQDIGLSGGSNATRFKRWWYRADNFGRPIPSLYVKETSYEYFSNFGPDGTCWTGSGVDYKKRGENERIIDGVKCVQPVLTFTHGPISGSHLHMEYPSWVKL